MNEELLYVLVMGNMYRILSGNVNVREGFGRHSSKWVYVLL